MRKQNNTPSDGSKAAKRIQTWDGTSLFEKYKDWLHPLKEATAVLSAALADISEFAPELTITELIKLHRNPIDYFTKLERQALDWVHQQRPIQQEYCAEQADRLMTVVRRAFQEWQKSYHNMPQVDGRHFPKRLVDINNLSGLFDGFTDRWFESIRDEFNEYISTPEQMELLEAMQTLADAANNMARFARHWQHRTNPLMAFCRYDSQAEKFVPSIEGINLYVNVYTAAPMPPAQNDEAAIARERLRNIIFQKTGNSVNTDKELLATEFYGDDEQSKAAKNFQETLRRNIS